MVVVKIKRVYEDGTILFIHPKRKIVYLFDGDTFKNTYKIEGTLNGKALYEALLKKPCKCGFKDYLQSVDISEKVKALVEG